MPVTSWNRITKDGREWLVIGMSELHIPLDWEPGSQIFIAVAAPSAGIGGFTEANFPALVKGDAGPVSTIEEAIDFTPLAYGDPTADFARLVKVSPATALTGEVYQLQLGLHLGPPGEDGTTSIDLDSIAGTPQFKRMIQINSSADGFEFVSPKVGDRYYPASLNSIAVGNPTGTLGTVAIPAQEFDWRPEIKGQTIVIPESPADVRVDLMARLNGETTGNIVARTFGIANATERLTFVSVPTPPGSMTDTYDKVLAGQPATIDMRVERQAGSKTFSAAASTSSFGVRVCPVP